MAGLGLSAKILARMRSDAEKLLPDTCTIQAVSTTPDGRGGFTETWSTASGGAGVKCRLDPFPREEQPETVAGREATIHRRMLTVPWDAPLDASKRVLVGTATYEVRDMMDDHSWRVVRRALVSKIEGL